MKTITLKLSRREELALLFFPGTHEEQLHALLAEKCESLAKRLEIGGPDKEKAQERLNVCRALLPDVQWQLSSWRLDGELYFSPYRLDGKSNLGDVPKRRVA